VSYYGPVCYVDAIEGALLFLEVHGSSCSLSAMALKRAACDKCHQVKSRCSKDSGSCRRCKRLGLACTYSPPLPMGRPGNKNANKEGSRHRNGADQNPYIRHTRAGDVSAQARNLHRSQLDEILVESRQKCDPSFRLNEKHNADPNTQCPEHHFDGESTSAFFSQVSIRTIVIVITRLSRQLQAKPNTTEVSSVYILSNTN